jgi:hypothetical protein
VRNAYDVRTALGFVAVCDVKKGALDSWAYVAPVEMLRLWRMGANPTALYLPLGYK